MPFDKNNLYGGRKLGAGRKPKLSTQVKRALGNIPVVDIFDKLQDLATKGDREACIYLLDRVLGKPTQKSELDLVGEVNISTDQMRDIYLKLVEIERALECPVIQIEEVSANGTS